MSDTKASKKSTIPAAAAAALLLAAALSAAADIFAAFRLYTLPIAALFAILIISAVLLYIPLRRSAMACRIIIILICAAAVIIIALGVIWLGFVKNSIYSDADGGKSAAFAGKKVMVIVPHEDDDINIMGGTVNEFLEYGSDVYIVFVTNGDCDGVETGKTRLRESLNVAKLLGIPEENIIFLGYGDYLSGDGTHIYNSGEETVISHAWCDRTYGLDEHSAYNDGALYTGENYLNDMVSVISEYRPDIIFACDYDNHIDHRAVSLVFDKAMGIVLKTDEAYKPLVFKAFSYDTSYYGTDDFESLNMRSTVNPGETDRIAVRPDYKWSERDRLPVSAASLSRSFYNNITHTALKLYQSQKAGEFAAGVINADKVFWSHRTDSLTYSAKITATSGDRSRLNDYMIIDSDNLSDDTHKPYDSPWVPDGDDPEKSATVTFDAPQYVFELCLYDSPDPESNVINAEILLSDGTVIESGELDEYGSPVNIVIDRDDISWFTVKLTDTEGPEAGLAEIEAYSTSEQDSGFAFIKLQSTGGDFAYDWYMSGETEQLTLYAYGCDVRLSDCTVTVIGDCCSAEVNDEVLTVTCPAGKECTVTVTTPDGTMSDSVSFSHAPLTVRIGQWAERFFRQHFLPEIRYSAYYNLARELL